MKLSHASRWLLAVVILVSLAGWIVTGLTDLRAPGLSRYPFDWLVRQFGRYYQ